jgi:hypothetical protein
MLPAQEAWRISLVKAYSLECVEGVFSVAATVFSHPPCGERDFADTRRRTVGPHDSRPAFFLVLGAMPFVVAAVLGSTIAVSMVLVMYLLVRRWL